ncbi:MAG TPA: type II toxin-antitoxin system VapC family toxin [Polyangiaceae bacterium]
MRAVDTNVIVRLITRDDDAQVRSAEAYIAASGAWISHVVLVEVVWVLTSVYELRRAEIARAVEMLLEQEHLVVQEPGIVAAALELFRKGGGRDFADCLIVEVARGAGHLPLGTFDRRLSKVAGAELL